MKTISNNNNAAMKRVCFHSDDTLRDVSPHHWIMSESEQASMFYTMDEMRGFRLDARAIRRNPSSLDESTDCWRGLEPYVSRKRELRATRRNYIFAVLHRQCENRRMMIKQNQQQQQLQELSPDDFDFAHDLSMVAREQSKESVQRALVSAIRDFVDSLQLMPQPLVVARGRDHRNQHAKNVTPPSYYDNVMGNTGLPKPPREIATARSA
ncbi:expressed unknown protein [Seminavis robusta]|uniref:Uncharacterized protein n=1 Tax=Seminavis robusta TaxID=568900 RepID=A0A9N8E5E5_9STRA|nr:expressed unknown protein [Seminavis robusta]|eukprot:Sro559_g166550.1 n/a (210) ;mRNA; r:52644-53273